MVQAKAARISLDPPVKPDNKEDQDDGIKTMLDLFEEEARLASMALDLDDGWDSLSFDQPSPKVSPSPSTHRHRKRTSSQRLPRPLITQTEEAFQPASPPRRPKTPNQENHIIATPTNCSTCHKAMPHVSSWLTLEKPGGRNICRFCSLDCMKFFVFGP